MARAGAILAMLLVIMIPTLTTTGSSSLQVRTANGEERWCVDANAGTEVQVQFTHSMYGGFVREAWRITPDYQLERVRFVTENAAAAEYYAADGSSYKSDDGYVVPGSPLQESELVIRVNNRGNHQLKVGDVHIDMAGGLQESTQVRITVQRGTCSGENAVTREGSLRDVRTIGAENSGS